MDKKKLDILNGIEKELSSRFQKLDEIALLNQDKVLSAFRKHEITNQHFAGTTGYGYTDKGKEGLSKVYSEIFGTEDAIVTPHLTSGTHAIATSLYGLLRPKDLLLSISGELYDTLHDTLFGKDNGSLESYNVDVKFVDLVNSHFDEERIYKLVKKYKPRVVFVQRSRGYSSRKALSVHDMEPIFKKVKEISPKSFIVVDNCYGEFMETSEPTDVGADVCIGSLIKNIGGGLAPTGGYIVGTKEALSLIENRLTCPSIGRETGSYEAGYRLFYQGLFLAPHIVAQAVKGAYLIGEVMKRQGYKIIPDTTENSYDIIKSIVFDTEEELIRFVQLIQKLSPIDSNAVPIPYDMVGYTTQVIMAAGTFVEGASIELSCDSPIKKPYIAYFQGGLTYEQLKIVAYNLLDFKNN
ncbi:MAG TPA: methionine gamma-lyase family protein [Candidatus Caccovivens faecavium]|nr:methionine gamma-lyase family protein [Candidatus Caccovivens faecavium]